MHVTMRRLSDSLDGELQTLREEEEKKRASGR
jgi:hypothetical protein